MRIEHNLPQLQKVLANISSGIEKKATVNALNRAAQQAKTEAKREVAKNYLFKPADVARTITVYRSNSGRVEASLVSKGKRTPLIAMGARQTKKGVTVKVSKVNKGRKLIPSAFIATMKSGHKGVWKRLTKKNLPFKELYTIAIPEAFGSKAVMDEVKSKFAESFFKRFEHELKRLTERNG